MNVNESSRKIINYVRKTCIVSGNYAAIPTIKNFSNLLLKITFKFTNFSFIYFAEKYLNYLRSLKKMAEYKLMYFNGKGLGELSRFIFAAADVPFEDYRIDFKDWPALKTKLPFGG